jgi:hypothetical protein
VVLGSPEGVHLRARFPFVSRPATILTYATNDSTETSFENGGKNQTMGMKCALGPR